MDESSLGKIDFLLGSLIAGTGGGYITTLIRKHTTEDPPEDPKDKERDEAFST